MLEDASNHELIDAWKKGDQDAAGLLFCRYQVRLMALVRSRMSRKLARRLDVEDVVLSAYRSFFTGAQNGRAGPTADDDLWPLLTTIALRKLARQARRHAADRRSVEREQENAADLMQQVAGREPTAEDAAVLMDEVEELLAKLDATAREVLVRTLQGADVVTIAKALSIHERTVRRALERIHQELASGEHEPPFRLRLSSRSTAPTAPLKVLKTTIQGTTTYDRYLLKQFIGAGAFSKVYRAVERPLGEVVAVKFLRKDCWSDDRAVTALLREYDILKRLNHSNILCMREWGTTLRGALFLVTDYISGMNLAEWRRKLRPSIPQIVSIAICVAETVAEAHREGVLHGDLTPANILRRDDGHVVLCDFGFARHATDPEDLPRGGTAGFLCPEQISDAFGPVTVQSDVYGLGGLLYALLTGQPPMTGLDLPEIFARVLSLSCPRAPSHFNVESSAELDAVVLRCLRKEPNHRFATAGDVAKALANLASQ